MSRHNYSSEDQICLQYQGSGRERGPRRHECLAQVLEHWACWQRSALPTPAAAAPIAASFGIAWHQLAVAGFHGRVTDLAGSTAVVLRGDAHVLEAVSRHEGAPNWMSVRLASTGGAKLHDIFLPSEPANTPDPRAHGQDLTM